MLYFIFTDDELIRVTEDGTTARNAMEDGCYDVVSRNDMKDVPHAELIADQAQALTGNRYVAVDNGLHHYPRYDVVRAPKVGDEVSYAFNGDYYPCGQVTKISKSLRRVETESGRTFWRKKLTAAWLENGTWSLIQGHVDKRNPHI